MKMIKRNQSDTVLELIFSVDFYDPKTIRIIRVMDGAKDEEQAAVDENNIFKVRIPCPVHAGSSLVCLELLDQEKRIFIYKTRIPHVRQVNRPTEEKAEEPVVETPVMDLSVHTQDICQSAWNMLNA